MILARSSVELLEHRYVATQVAKLRADVPSVGILAVADRCDQLRLLVYQGSCIEPDLLSRSATERLDVSGWDFHFGHVGLLLCLEGSGSGEVGG